MFHRNEENEGERKADTLVALFLELESGTPVSLSVSCNAFLGHGHRVSIYGDEGTLILENPTSDHVSGFRLLLGTRETGCLLPTAAPGWQKDGVPDGPVAIVGRIVERFANCVIGGSGVALR